MVFLSIFVHNDLHRLRADRSGAHQIGHRGSLFSSTIDDRPPASSGHSSDAWNRLLRSENLGSALRVGNLWISTDRTRVLSLAAASRSAHSPRASGGSDPFSSFASEPSLPSRSDSRPRAGLGILQLFLLPSQLRLTCFMRRSACGTREVARFAAVRLGDRHSPGVCAFI